MLHAFESARALRPDTLSSSGPGQPDDADFLPGEAVVYRAHGVGRVDHVGKRLIGDDTIEMIQVSFPKSAMVLLIPRRTAAQSGLRHISSREIADAAFRTIVARPRTLRGIWAKRSDEILRKINSGRLDHVAQVVRDLRHHARSTAGSVSERQLFEMAMERLTGELAAITGRSGPDTMEQVYLHLLEANAKIENVGS